LCLCGLKTCKLLNSLPFFLHELNQNGGFMEVRAGISRLLGVLGLLFFMAAPIFAQDLPGEGALLRKGPEPVAIPLKQTDVRISVTGFIASVDVEQTFTNQLNEKIEAVYIFPLPAESAVDDMEIKVGGRTIRGVIKEREEARRDYEQALNMGQQAALLEQERPNIFTSSVANIEPGVEIVVRIHYTERLSYDDGGFRLVFPMVVAPRYNPGTPLSVQKTDAVVPDTRSVPDASKITPPVLPSDKRPGTNISLSIDLNSGFPVKKIRSISHEIKTEKLNPSHYSVRLARLDEIPNKDFVIEYKFAGEQPEAALVQALGTQGEGYFLLMAAPPSDFRTKDLRPKEMIFIIDRSGSMAGEKIVQAKNALRTCLHGLNPQDSFNIIAFSSGFQPMAEKSLPFTQQNLDAADQFVDKITANGGTEMLPALLHALKQPPQLNMLRVIVFLTDGQIGNEAELLQQVSQRLGTARIFTFGIDSAVNERFIKKLAQIGRGKAEFLLPHQKNIETVINNFQNRISAPMLTDLAIDWAGLDVYDIYPNPLPDLYMNQPVFITGKFRRSGNRQIALRALSAVGLTSLPVQIDTTRSNAELRSLAALWARTRIEQLTDKLLDTPDDPTVKDEITRLAIEYKLLSPFTSFVALEEQLVVPADGGPAKKILVPVASPSGWDDGSSVIAQEERDLKQSGLAFYYAGNPANKPQQKTVIDITTTKTSGPALATQPLTSPPSDIKLKQGSAVGKVDSRQVGELPKVMPRQRVQMEPRREKEAKKNSGKGGAVGIFARSDRGAGSADMAASIPPPAPPVNEAPLMKDKAEMNLAGLEGQVLDSDTMARYLSRKQAVSGAWSDLPYAGQESLRTTALATIAFIASGNTARKGSYQPQVRHAIEYIIANVDTLPPQTGVKAIALWALSESLSVSTVSGQKKTAEALLENLLKLQSRSGLWLSHTGGQESSQATVWAAIALRSSKNAGLTVDNKILEAAAAALEAKSKSSNESTLVSLLADKKIAPEVASNLKQEMLSRNWGTEWSDAAFFNLILLRKLDDGAFKQIEAKLGQTFFDPSRPVTTSAMRYLTIALGSGTFVALQ
jgi:Ca-activated chloride channel homolog